MAKGTPGTQGRLLADIGGTNARFAWQENDGATIVDLRRYPSADGPSLLDAVRRYLADTGRGSPAEAAIAIATPVTGDQVQMTNHHWSFSISGLQTSLQLQRLRVLNDFEALALALPALQPDELHVLGGGSPAPGAPRAVIGPGTGLGVAGLVSTAAGELALDTEGGHVSLSPANEREAAVVLTLQRRFGHASAERALSGPGLVWLYEALCEIDGVAASGVDNAAGLIERARAGTDAHCVEALQMFFALLGSVAGNLALTLGARGGVYLGGGILPRLVDLIETSTLRARFEAKGRFASYLAPIPLYLIQAQRSPALLGASRALAVNP
jgi:glucokinase